MLALPLCIFYQTAMTTKTLSNTQRNQHIYGLNPVYMKRMKQEERDVFLSLLNEMVKNKTLLELKGELSISEQATLDKINIVLQEELDRGFIVSLI